MDGRTDTQYSKTIVRRGIKAIDILNKKKKKLSTCSTPIFEFQRLPYRKAVPSRPRLTCIFRSSGLQGSVASLAFRFWLDCTLIIPVITKTMLCQELLFFKYVFFCKMLSAWSDSACAQSDQALCSLQISHRTYLQTKVHITLSVWRI